MRIITILAISLLMISCSKTETSRNSANFYGENVAQDSTKIEDRLQKNAEIKNPDLDMDYTLAHLNKEENVASEKHKKWLQSLRVEIYNDENLPMLSKNVKDIHFDLTEIEYPDHLSITNEEFDKKWKNKVDYKYLGWNHYFYDGQDGPDHIRMNADYLGRIDDYYYYKMTIISLDKEANWPSQSGKIFKVEKVNDKPLITGIFLKGESVVTSQK